MKKTLALILSALLLLSAFTSCSKKPRIEETEEETKVEATIGDGDNNNNGDNNNTNNDNNDNTDNNNTDDNGGNGGNGGNGDNTGDNGGNTGDNGGNTGDNGGNSGDNGGNTGDNGDNTGDNGGNTGDNGGNTGDNGGNTGDNGGNGGNSGDNGDGADDTSTPKPIDSAEALKDIVLNGNYYLTGDLDLNGAEWTPIGDENNPFTGSFNGNGHTISNFVINDELMFAGLFGANAGTIENLKLSGVTIDITNNSTSLYIGALVAKNTGSVKKCFAEGNLSGKVINTETNKAAFIGGLVGYDYKGTVEECAANCKISSYSSSNGSCAGGLVGYAYLSSVINCYATGDVESSYDLATEAENSSTAGGLIGHNPASTVRNCYASGTVISKALKGGLSFAGGLIGDHSRINIGTSDNPEYVIGEISGCYAIGNVMSEAKLGASATNGSAFCGYVNPETTASLTNNYYCAEQTVNSVSIFTYGEEKALSDIKSEAFHLEALKWSADVWSITEGNLPTLKALA